MFVDFDIFSGGGQGRWTREERENPPSSRVLGCFGLSQRTGEKNLLNVFERYGPVEKVMLIIDRKTQISKGYAFIYFENPMDAQNAKEACTGIELDGRPIRVDFSLTKRPHSPTPGTYLGRRHANGGGGGSYNKSSYGGSSYNNGGGYNGGGRYNNNNNNDHGGGGRYNDMNNGRKDRNGMSGSKRRRSASRSRSKSHSRSRSRSYSRSRSRSR